MVIDAHLHLWDKQLGRVGENKVVALKDGKVTSAEKSVR